MGELAELHDVVVVDCSTDLAGAYCAKLFAEAGATVTRVEPPQGDPMRRWQWSGEPTDGDGPLFRYLRHGQRSVVAEPGAALLDALLAGADLVLTSGPGLAGDPSELASRLNGAVVVSTTPYGLSGPYADRPATEFTVQADSGALALRGIHELPPFQMGARIVEWVGGAYAAVGALAGVLRARRTGHGELLDLSLCEVANLTGGNFADLFHSLAGRPPIDPSVPNRSVEIPSIEPTADGWVGFNTNTREQWESFCILIERPDLLDDAEFASLATRVARAQEWNAMVRAWTTRHPTAEIVERAAALRIPVAPVSDGRSLLELDHPRERGVWRRDPHDDFTMPRRPYRFDGEDPPALGPAPTLGQHTGEPAPQRRPRPEPAPGPAPLPLGGLTVVDLTAWWAGPSGAATFAALGAEVVHVESTRRMDGMRTAGGAFFGRDQWWEYSGFFLQANTNKYDVTLDLDRPEGRAMVLELVARADIVIENYTPRVVENFGLDWPVIHETNPRAVMVRMPAFGLDGPWRDRPGFAQTMEQITGLAWMTGHPEDQPRIQRGPCDPNGGLHAAFAALVALQRRERTGEGCLVEAPMFEAALNVAVEPVLEWSAFGRLIEREGNRSPAAAPQNLYATDAPERWLALSCATDDHFAALAKVIGHPELTDDPELASLAGRRRHHDRLDQLVGEWAAGRSREDALAELVGAGVPAAPCTDSRRASDQEQMRVRGYFEAVDHPVVGTHPTPGLPFRYAGLDRWIRRPAPTIGQHNAEVLGGWLGHDTDELAALTDQGVIGTRPLGA
jgi:crotonobetainyl-CoA:carnitine CoA-transferase CaiB-like acyl-CoA transferase